MLYDPDSVTWFYTEDREVKPQETISGAIQAETPMDAVVCYNDQVAVEVIRTLREFGKKYHATSLSQGLTIRCSQKIITSRSRPFSIRRISLAVWRQNFCSGSSEAKNSPSRNFISAWNRKL